jgi:sugar/nucleoside kinase (ribokinase family)
MGFKIGVVGPLNIDIIIKGNAPVNIEELNRWSGPSDIHILTAGAAGYIAQNLNRLGNEIHLVSSIGDDSFGKMILDILTKSGINTKYIVVEQGKECAIAIFILLFGNDKRPLTFRLPTHSGWPKKFDKRVEDHLLDTELLHSAGYFHFPDLWNDNFVALLKKAKSRGLTVSIDPQFPLSSLEPPWIKVLKPLIPYIDILMVDQQETLSIMAKNSIEEAAKALLEEGFKIIAIKLGDKGVLVKDASIMKYVHAITPKRFVDTIGAGDAFDAGFLHAILEGKDLENSAKAGILTATNSIQNVGGFINKNAIKSQTLD